MEGPIAPAAYVAADGLVGEEDLGPLKGLRPSVGKCQDQETGVGGLVNRGKRDGIGGFWRENQERG